jgi:hypothetical protein
MSEQDLAYVEAELLCLQRNGLTLEELQGVVERLLEREIALHRFMLNNPPPERTAK